jgi:hypothetical protein
MESPENDEKFKESASALSRAVSDPIRRMLAGKGKYVGVALIFLVATWYGIVVVPTTGLKKDSKVSLIELDEDMLRPDLEGDRPSKTYSGLLDSRPGDIYRIGIRARAIDGDETLRIFAVSEIGEEREVGTVRLSKEGRETFSEFLFRADGIYRTLIVRKEGETEEERWRGGRVAVPSLVATRLEVRTVAEAEKLSPTLSRQARPDRIVATEPEGSGKVSFPDDVSFEKWGIFRSVGIRMFSVTFSLRQLVPGSDALHALEVREYDPDTRMVGKRVASLEFSEVTARSVAKDRGATVFELPTKLDPGRWYLVGSVRKTKDAPPVSFLDIADDSGEHGPFLVEMVREAESEEADRLLFGAKVEDLGSDLLRYSYVPLGTAFDFFDLSDASESVTFDPGNGFVTGRAEVDEYFTYRFDTVRPFREMSVSAEQYHDYEDQISIDYSFDGKSDWVEIPYTQDVKEAQEFSGKIAGDGKRDVVYVRVRYAGEKDEKRDFALSRFRVTASLVK